MDIRLIDIAKRFGETGALAGISLDIADGELVALLGPSGSGKTTLLRVIAGLDVPTSGCVLFANEDATNVPVQRRRIGFVFQHYALFRHMSVFDNVAYGLRVRPRAERPDPAEMRRRVMDLLDLVQLSGLDRRYPGQLSGGQQQRVALARALAVDPRVLLLDEPFGALDAKVRKDLRRWVRDIHDRTGHTTIFVTHDQEEALELADRVAILNAGRIEQVGTADEVYDKPASPFVMAFVGDTSSLPVTVGNGRVMLDGRALTADVIGSADGATQFYIRPGDAVLTDAGAADAVGTVQSVRRTATGRRVQLRLDVAATMMELEAPPFATVKTGESVGVKILRGRLFG